MGRPPLAFHIELCLTEPFLISALMQLLVLLIAGCLQLACAFLCNAPSLLSQHARITPECRRAIASGKQRHAYSLLAAKEEGSADAAETRDQYRFNAQVQALGRSNNWQGVLILLDEAKMEEFEPNSHAWRAAIQAMGKQ
jgi:hypothetical protein